MVSAFRNDVMSSSRRAGLGPAGKRLSEVLFGKLNPDIDQIRHIHILPDGPLWYLPFEALPAPGWVKGQVYEKLYEIAPLSYAPSVTLLRDLIGHIDGERLWS